MEARYQEWGGVTGGKERALFTRRLRESVLALCREAWQDHRRFLVDGIVCVSLEEDDTNGDNLEKDDDEEEEEEGEDSEGLRTKTKGLGRNGGRGRGCGPIVVTIHEQLGKAGEDHHPVDVSPPPSLPPRAPYKGLNEGRRDAPLGKKTLLLRHALEEAQRDDVDDVEDDISVTSASPCPTLQRRCQSEDAPPPRKVARRDEEDKEEDGGGHCSDPTPLRRRRRSRKGAVEVRKTGGIVFSHSLSHSSVGSSDQAPVRRVGGVSMPRPHSLSPQADPLCLQRDPPSPQAQPMYPQRDRLYPEQDPMCPEEDLLCPKGDSLYPKRGPLCLERDPLSPEALPSFPQRHPLSLCTRAGSASPPEDPTPTPAPAPAIRPRPPVCGRAAGLRLSCKRCDLELADLLSLERHHRQAHALFTCPQCLATFTTCNNLKRHARLHTGSRPFKCPQCGAAFSRRDDLKAHRLRHHGHRSHHHHNSTSFRGRWQDRRCYCCSYVATSSADLRKHLLSHFTRNRLACGPCAISFPEPLSYTTHFKLHDADPDFRRFPCCFCSAVLPSYRVFAVHQQSHLLQQVPTTSLQLNGKAFLSPGLLQYDLTSHEPQPGPQDLCSADAERRADDAKDEEEEEEARGDSPVAVEDRSGGPRQAWCTECQVGFPSEEALIQHIALTHEVAGGSSGGRPRAEGRAGSEEEEEEEEEEEVWAVQLSQEDSTKDKSDSEEGRPGPGKDSTLDKKSETQREAKGGEVRDDAQETRQLRTGQLRTGQLRTGQADSSQSVGTLKGLSARSEGTGHLAGPCSLEDATSAARSGPCPDPCHEASIDSCTDSCSDPSTDHCPDPCPDPRPAAPAGKSSPLRVVPLALSRDDGTPRQQQIVLVKPKDLFRSTASTFPLTLLRPHPQPSDVTPRHPDSAEEAPELLANFLHVKRTAVSLLRGGGAGGRRDAVPATDGRQSIKQEPLSDHEAASSFSPNFALFPTLLRHQQDLLNRGLDHDQDQDLPTDLSMTTGMAGRSSSTASSNSSSSSPSPRSQSSDGSGRVPSFEKVVTPEVLYRARSSLQCQVSGCGQRFPQFSQLEEHSAHVHRRHLCGYCGKSFTAKPNRDRHVRYHTGVKPYKCHLCSQAFYRGDDLKYHRTTKHARETAF